MFFVLGYILTEFELKRFLVKSKFINSVIVFVCIFLTGCNSDTYNILQGTIAWHNKDYKVSVAKYKDVAENKENENSFVQDYALYNLGASYSMLNEEKSAIEKFSQISSDSPKSVQYGAFYNMGVIHFKNGEYDLAKELFKQAIQIDNTKIEAKINMELSIKMVQAEVKQNQSEAVPAAESKEKMPDMEDALFEHIKEQDKKQWKNSEENQNIDYSLDY